MTFKLLLESEIPAYMYIYFRLHQAYFTWNRYHVYKAGYL
jgi:hypothetical protein